MLTGCFDADPLNDGSDKACAAVHPLNDPSLIWSIDM
jgi:hypothetical protein